MSDTSLRSLIKRCQEKEKQGYDYVTQIKKVPSGGSGYVMGYGGQYEKTHSTYNLKYKVAMKKVN